MDSWESSSSPLALQVSNESLAKCKRPNLTMLLHSNLLPVSILIENQFGYERPPLFAMACVVVVTMASLMETLFP